MANGNTSGQSGPSPNTAAGWGGVGGGVVGGLWGIFASADSGNPISMGMWTIAGGAIVGIITAASAFLVAYLNNATKLQKEIGDLRDQFSQYRNKSDLEFSTFRDKADKENRDLRSKLHDSEMREKDLKYDLERAQRRIEVLETATGVSHPIAAFGVVVADFEGIIQEFSPSLTPILGWMPDEMRGMNIEKMVPTEYIEAHRAKFFAATKPGVVLDPTKKINTYALDKNGKSVPVSISVRKWSGEGNKLMTATITIRPSAAAGTVPHGTPQRRITDV